ncbi:uncharacterized protein CELE_F20B6.9 [Caenorhabditis elegans]|uniref:Uncharacterized protein n=1 Tax=Caenorhabditis elegans TaxID=6239 RepID=Q95ZV1_CAEEL|nr:Uncharacterized protein CELE_F20B6.9 [Caenorhabditis elegans]CCD69764.1 Uncharacterized protein CELE_F20B6.9 [Caenorhabditis elegans]|eukprot:NP_508716.1 Uncharacterized protein CELE_F20B6.9 [Caenorhabditis elegans]
MDGRKEEWMEKRKAKLMLKSVVQQYGGRIRTIGMNGFGMVRDDGRRRLLIF